MLKANFHMHTNLCDGKDSPEDMVLKAIELKMEHIGFSGHFDPGVYMDLPKYKKEIRALQEKYRDKIDILLGAEVDCVFDPETAYGCEYRIGSTHNMRLNDGNILSVDESPEVMEKLCTEYFGGDYYKLSKAYYELEATVVDVVKPDIIGHFDMVVKFNERMHFLDEGDKRYTGPAFEAMEHLSKYGIPFEINTAAFYRGVRPDFYPRTEFLKALRSFGGRIIISSDAHEKENIRGAFREAVDKAIECGFTHTVILKHDSENRIITEELPLDSL